MKVKILVHNENMLIYLVEYVWYTSGYFRIKTYERNENQVFRRIYKPVPFTLKDFYIGKQQ